MMQLSEKFFSFLFLLIPLFLITGPALPDIVITLVLNIWNYLFCLS